MQHLAGAVLQTHEPGFSKAAISHEEIFQKEGGKGGGSQSLQETFLQNEEEQKKKVIKDCNISSDTETAHRAFLFAPWACSL